MVFFNFLIVIKKDNNKKKKTHKKDNIRNAADADKAIYIMP